MIPRLIPNAALTVGQIPSHRVTMLDPKGFTSFDEDLGPHSQQWSEIWTFALTFNGYSYFGDDDGAPGRLNAFVESIETAFRKSGKLPAIDLAMLRACLFQQQRYWCKWGGVMERDCPPETAKFIDSLLVGIREGLS